MSKAGPSLLRATFYRAADTARRQDPQLAKIYHTQMAERGANHLKEDNHEAEDNADYHCCSCARYRRGCFLGSGWEQRRRRLWRRRN